ncbi:MAG TPA: hypothetical protein VK700_22470 [Steroidobacteraceae bacterium]|nr:hypothetical protein [Steroidobacteraceae bacterium]
MNRRRLAGIAVMLGAVAGPASATTPAAATTMTCTNPVSGANWKISVDFARSTVDAYPARISDASIAWHDQKDGGNYTLDRKTGKLTVIVASSTGGYFLYDLCRPDPLKPVS